MRLVFEQDSETYMIDLAPGPSANSFKASIDSTPFEIVLSVRAASLDLLIDGQPVTAFISSDGPKRWVTVDGCTFLLTRSAGGRGGAHAHHAAGELTAPMPGQVRAVNVSLGDAVHKGQTLMLLEAMKMEIRVQSPQDGRVKAVHVRQGQTVEREQLLVEVE